MDFKKFKLIILERAKIAGACIEEYTRAYKAKDYSELMQVIKDNFRFAAMFKVIDPSLIETYKDQFTANQIFCNMDVTSGFLLASGSATVRASGSATVEALDSATVIAWGSATVEAWGSATVRAWGSATVEASGSATVEASDSATVRASDSATVEAWGSATVRASDSATVEASDSATVRASDSATVRASGSAYITSNYVIECKIQGNAIYRIRETNTIMYASDNMRFKKL